MCALETVLTRHRSAQCHHRVLFGVGGQQPGSEVCCARTRGDQHHSRCAGEAPDRCCHERSILLMPAHHQRRTPVDQRIEDSVDLGAGNPENVVDTLSCDDVDDFLRAAHIYATNFGHHNYLSQ